MRRGAGSRGRARTARPGSSRAAVELDPVARRGRGGRGGHRPARVGAALLQPNTGRRSGPGRRRRPVRLAVGVDVAIPVPLGPGDVPRAAPAGHDRSSSFLPALELHGDRWLGEHPRHPRPARSLVRDRRPIHVPRRPDVPRRDLDLPPARRRVDRLADAATRRRDHGQRPRPVARRAHPDLNATAPTPVTIGGATGSD